MSVAVVDYGMSNLGSVVRALSALGADVLVATRPEQLSAAERIVIPGVGSFDDGMVRLRENGWVDEIRAQAGAGKPLLGICLGMQFLATRGTEHGIHAGLDLVTGEVLQIDALGCQLRMPHIGWNNIMLDDRHNVLFAGIPDGTDFYFVHSFAFQAAVPSDVCATTHYGTRLTAAVACGNVFGTQFHPEKSSKAGFRVLQNFLRYRPC